jgi:hypothetical protein
MVERRNKKTEKGKRNQREKKRGMIVELEVVNSKRVCWRDG